MFSNALYNSILIIDVAPCEANQTFDFGESEGPQSPYTYRPISTSGYRQGDRRLGIPIGLSLTSRNVLIGCANRNAAAQNTNVCCMAFMVRYIVLLYCAEQNNTLNDSASGERYNWILFLNVCETTVRTSTRTSMVVTRRIPSQ